MDGQFEQFFARLALAPASALMLDYDGTLAPFSVERREAAPYPGVAAALAALAADSPSELVLISGRPVSELHSLLPLSLGLQVWGCHGLERSSGDGGTLRLAVAPRAEKALAEARRRATEAGLAGRLEVKPGCLALHWRGLTDAQARELEAQAQQAWGDLGERHGLMLCRFDGGLELRSLLATKAAAVEAVKAQLGPRACIAYLGDDLTDEDAFAALSQQGLSVLVRPERRRTRAQAWLRPPEGLLWFLERWRAASARQAPGEAARGTNA